ncbi:MAG: glycosyltransferase, partial [Bacteroidia bacterium]|nr:glycosyltransferase [Bacteroidia bacterium]
ILSLGDLFLLPSETESFGLAALEAMACGVPVIGSDTGGLPEVVTHEKNGYLCPVGDIDGMSQYAIRMLLNSQLHEQLVFNAKQTAHHFRLENILPLYELLYERVLQGKHGLKE